MLELNEKAPDEAATSSSANSLLTIHQVYTKRFYFERLLLLKNIIIAFAMTTLMLKLGWILAEGWTLVCLMITWPVMLTYTFKCLDELLVSFVEGR